MILSGILVNIVAQDYHDDKNHGLFFNDLYVTPSFHTGLVLPEYQYFLYLIEDHVRSVGLNISKRTWGKNDWEQLYRYPEYGFSLFYSTLGNDSVFGREIALCPFFKYHIFSRHRFSVDNQIGLGISYVTRKFDLEENYSNIAIGSNLNIHFNFRLDLSYQLLQRYRVHTGIAFDHFSNANMQEPNVGINYLTSYIGFGYRIGQGSNQQIHELEPHKRDLHLELTYAFGGKRTRAFQSTFFFTSSAAVEMKWKPFRVLHIGLGADLFYDSSTETEMLALNLTGHKGHYDFRTGLHISQEVLYNKISLIIQEGIYLFLIDRINHKTMYNRGMVRYALTDHIMVSISMKSHLHILDYPEIGLGYRF
ncbi:MAG: acyloxyacyl hydrolase [Bacteroidales bacterium]|nr:acyloxyacyl hydrolase [Bacteroidales bacterium]